MRAHTEEGDCIEFNYPDPISPGWTSTVSIPVDVFLVFAEQAKTLEQLRCLVFAWPKRKTATATYLKQRREQAKAKAATA